MKFLLILVAVLGLTAADDVDGVNYFVHCAYKAIVDGIPSIPVPKHNPLSIQDVNYEKNDLLYQVKIALTDNILYDLLTTNFTKLDVKSLTKPNRVNIDYNLYWPVLHFTGNFDVSIHSLLYSSDSSGTYDIVLHHTNWFGVADYVKPDQPNVITEVDEFSLSSTVKSVDVTLTGLDEPGIVEKTVKDAIYLLFNHFPSKAADFLREKRFNEFWIGHPEWIKAVYDHCAEA